jgi:hypothetical protein
MEMEVCSGICLRPLKRHRKLMEDCLTLVRKAANYNDIFWGARLIFCLYILVHEISSYRVGSQTLRFWNPLNISFTLT